jgi:hypothetical protein
MAREHKLSAEEAELMYQILRYAQMVGYCEDDEEENKMLSGIIKKIRHAEVLHLGTEE